MFNHFSDKVKGPVNKVKDEVIDKIDNDNADKIKGQAQDKYGELKDKYNSKK